MDDLLKKNSELENRIYVIGGPHQQALEEAKTILFRATDRCFISTEFICQKDSSMKPPPPASERGPCILCYNQKR